MINRNRWNSLSRIRRGAARAALALGLAVTVASCTSAQRDGRATSYLIIQAIETKDGNTLRSDVLTLVETEDAEGNQVLVPTVFNDDAEVIFLLASKDPNARLTPANSITVTRYRVDFVRSDGRNAPGVDVPYGFDGAFTASVDDTGGGGTFEVVRVQSKLEPPLRNLAELGGSVAISALARITFFGHDQAGREVSVTGEMGITFADWGDEE